ncbi:hypothetical protein MMC17_003069 [Xylographa soralifera]|nr:hypothetical protein [Xylographa soralifera]
MPPPLLSIAERTEPASPTTERSPLIPTINNQPATQPPLTIPLSPSLPSPTTQPPKRPLPQQVFDLLCIPYRKRAKPTPPTSSPPQQPASRIPRCHRRRRTSFDNKYHSFPPPVFTGRGQPRALDSRLYPELLADEEEHSHAHASDDDRHFWTARPHLWAEIVAAQRGDAGDLIAEPDAQPLARADEADNAGSAPTAKPNPLPEPNSQNADSQAALQPSQSPLRLSLRGGGGPAARLPDAQRLPPIAWRLAGGFGPPPTAGEYRAWRAREKERIAEANAKNGRKEEGRGFWREVCWVLVGARWEDRRRRRRRRRRGDGDGDEASGGSGSAARGDGGEGGGVGEADGAGGGTGDAGEGT